MLDRIGRLGGSVTGDLVRVRIDALASMLV
jgi:hypothetical protein